MEQENHFGEFELGGLLSDSPGEVAGVWGSDPEVDDFVDPAEFEGFRQAVGSVSDADDFVDVEAFEDFGEGTFSEDSIFRVEDESVEEEDGESEDLRVMRSMQDQALEYGYQKVSDLTYGELELLINRVKWGGSTENLREIVSSQTENLRNLINTMSSVQATLIPREELATAYERVSAFSADPILGTMVCQKVNGWVNEKVRLEPGGTVDSLYLELTNSPVFSQQDIAFKEGALYRYLETIVPIVKLSIERKTSQIKRDFAQRRNVAEYLVKEEVANTKALLEAKSYSIIRQIIEDGDGGYTTTCPVCGSEVKVDKPVFKIIAYASESSPGKSFFIEKLQCGCGNVLLFTLDEYAEMTKDFLKGNMAYVRAYLDDAKINCQGAAAIQLGASVGAVQDSIQHLMVMAKREEVKTGQEKVRREIYVDNLSFRSAVKAFYTKLCGLKRGTDNGSTGVNVIAAGNAMFGRAENCGAAIAAGGGGRYSYSELARYAMQCLSKDYQTEKNRALFSLVREIKSNPFICERLSLVRTWDLEGKLEFLKRYRNLQNPRSLDTCEVNDLKILLASLGKVCKDTEELLPCAIGCIPSIVQMIKKAKDDREMAVEEFRRMKDVVSHLKMIKVGSCRLEELQEFVGDKELAGILDVVADQMLLHHYAEEFYNYWKALRVVRESRIDDILTQKSDLVKIRDSLQKVIVKIVDDGAGSMNTTLSRIQLVYDRDAASDKFLHKLRKAVLACDYHDFCTLMINIPQKLYGKEEIVDYLYSVYSGYFGKLKSVASMPKQKFYFRDFTEEEILSCADFQDLKIGRFIPKRMSGESPEEYCARYYKMCEQNSWDCLECRDNSKMFEGLNTIMLSLCATVQDAGYPSRSVTMFMSGMFDIVHYDVNRGMAGKLLGISAMHQNILTSAKGNMLFLPESRVTYRAMYGYYLTSICGEMERCRAKLHAANVSVNDSIGDMSQCYDLRGMLSEILGKEYYECDEEGVPVNDLEDAEYELLSCIGYTHEQFYAWLGGGK